MIFRPYRTWVSEQGSKKQIAQFWQLFASPNLILTGRAWEDKIKGTNWAQMEIFVDVCFSRKHSIWEVQIAAENRKY